MKHLMRKFVLVLAILMAVLSVASPAMAASQNKAIESTARMYVELGIETEDGAVVPAGYSTGSCFAVGAKRNGPVKYFVTNRHVVECEEVRALYASMGYNMVILGKYIIFDTVDTKVSVEVHTTNQECDLAIVELHTATEERKPITIRTMEQEEATETKVVAIGFPAETDDFLYFYENPNAMEDKLYSTPADATVTKGEIAKATPASETNKGELYAFTAIINNGNSGGPLVDEKGNLVGVNTYGSENFSYAVTSNEVVRMLENRGIDYIAYNPLRTVLIWGSIGIAAIAIAVVVIVVVSKNKPVHGRALFGEKGSLVGQKFVLKRKTYIGRDSAKCSIVFPSSAPGVSKVHCCVGYDGKEVIVMDLNSKYGTWIDDHKLTPNTPTRLHRGHTLYIGSESEGLMLRNE